MQSGFGVVGLLAIAWAISENRRAVSFRRAAIGLAATFATAVLFLKVPGVTAAFSAINNAVDAIADVRINLRARELALEFALAVIESLARDGSIGAGRIGQDCPLLNA